MAGRIHISPIKLQRIRQHTNEECKEEAFTLNPLVSFSLDTGKQDWNHYIESSVSGPSGRSDKTNFTQRNESLILFIPKMSRKWGKSVYITLVEEKNKSQ